MQTQLAKWGNSLAVRIPRRTLEEARFSEGDRFDLVVVEPGSISIQATRKKATLKQMVARVTAENMHGEADWGAPVGREVW